MNGIQMTFLTLLLPFSALASESPISPSEEFSSAIARMNVATLKLETREDQTLDLFRSLWKKKCAQSKRSHCFLTENDMNPKSGSPDKILLFRGEPDRYSSPLVAALVRGTFAPNNNLCPPPCNSSTLSRKLKGMLEAVLPIENFTHQQGGWSPAIYYDESDAKWKESDASKPSDKLYLKDLTPPTEKETITAMNLIGNAHITYQVHLLDTKGAETDLDPLVSLTPNPDVALHFTRTQGKTGRLFAFLVPKRSIGKGTCRDWLGNPGEMSETPATCSFGDRDDFNYEVEVDAYFFAPIQLLSRVLLVEKDWLDKQVFEEMN